MTRVRERLPAGLLVSVRSPDEAMAAVAGGAAIIDVKDPASGPLGRADAAVAAAIGLVVGDAAPWTLACGELADGPPAIVAHLATVAASADGGAAPAAVKAGPAGLDARRWAVAYRELATLLPGGVEAVAVAYADARVAGAVDPRRLMRAAAECGAASVLIDTFDKKAGSLFEVAGEQVVRDWVARARDLGLRVALAGRLSAVEAAKAVNLGAEIVGVRSAACAGGRMGTVDREHVAAVVGTLANAAIRHQSDDAGRRPGTSPVKKLEVRVPHQLEPAEVRRRLDEAVIRARDEYADKVGAIDSAWRDDGRLELSLDVMGMAIATDVEILTEELVVRLEVPGMAGLFAGRIKSGIEERLGGLLEGRV
ncbi:MAG: polyhydroxyalkanoic acid system family protein [Planctomycetaceae bacterium]